MEKTLVIIDMQTGFESSHDASTIDAVLREIRAAKRVGDAIIVVEYSDFGNTHFVIENELRGYEHVAHTSKWRDDGSDRIIDVCLNRDFPHDNFKVCGVNRAFCVARTVCGLLTDSDKCQIEIIDDACHQEDRHKLHHFFVSVKECYGHIVKNGLITRNVKISNPKVLPATLKKIHFDKCPAECCDYDYPICDEEEVFE